MAIHVTTPQKTKEVHSVKKDPLVQAFTAYTPAELDTYISDITSVKDIKSVLRSIVLHLYLLHNG